MRHRRGADRALAADLRKVAQRDIGPDIGAEVVQNPVEASDVGVELGLPVVALDLRGQRVPDETEPLDEARTDLLPIRIGDGRQMSAIGAGRAIELPEVIGRLDPDTLAALSAEGCANAKDALPSFRDYWNAVPGAKGVKLDWEGTYRNWCRRDSGTRNIDRSSKVQRGLAAHTALSIAKNDLMAELDAKDAQEGGYDASF